MDEFTGVSFEVPIDYDQALRATKRARSRNVCGYPKHIDLIQKLIKDCFGKEGPFGYIRMFVVDR